MTQKGSTLQFQCRGCRHPVDLPLFQLSSTNSLRCSECQTVYTFDDPKLRRQIGIFEALCRQIIASEEILSNAAIGVNVQGHEVKIPYRILLTRFTPSLNLNVGGTPITITFVLEPKLDLHEENLI